MRWAYSTTLPSTHGAIVAVSVYYLRVLLGERSGGLLVGCDKPLTNMTSVGV